MQRVRLVDSPSGFGVYSDMNKPWEIVTVYKVYHTDGGGMGSHCGTIGYFKLSSDAENARGPNPYTGMREVRALKVGGDYFLLRSEQPIDLDNVRANDRERLREQALAKLTPAERAALGVKGKDKEET